MCGVAAAQPVAKTANVAEASKPVEVGLPPFDIRFQSDGTPARFVRDSLARHAKGAAAAAALARLSERVEFLSVDDDAIMGTPRFVRSWKQYLTGENPNMDPSEVVRNFITEYAALFEIDGNEIPAARITRNYTDEHNGVTHLTFQQRIKGIDLFDSGIKANVDRNGRLINISSTMLPRPRGDFSPPEAKFSELEAIRAAAAGVGVVVKTDPTPAEEPQEPARKRRWNNSDDFRMDQAIETQPVYFPMSRDDIRAAWFVLVPTKGVGHTYEMVIDASDGTVLHRVDQLCEEVGSATILASTTGSSPVCGGQTRYLFSVDPSATSPGSPFGWFDTNGVAGPEFYDTRGNNVDAHTDTDADNVADSGSRPSGGFDLLFAPLLNFASSPETYRAASVVQGFYYVNHYHDRLYGFGFTEAAGNFQTNNYGRGGIGNDAIQLDCQDGSGTNNANFGTPADGSPGRCQMYLWTSTTPNRDSTFDAGVMYHELTHGLSNRLTGGPANSSALNNVQSGGMGEGWSDFVALCLTSSSTDDPNGVYPVGTYVLGQACNGAGIRRRQYSTNMGVNPLTFDAYGTSGTTPYGIARSTQVHNSGELWCSALWDCRGFLYEIYGFAANDLILQLVVDAMKLQPANPSFTQARDAVLAADLVLTGGANQRMLWTAFARRALGFSASTASSSATSMTIATDMPPATENGFWERTEAGDLPGTAMRVYASSTPTRITGTLTANDADMFRITICDRAAFIASTVGGPSGFNTFNTQLFLFSLSGAPVVFNDDSGATVQSRITGALVPSNGDYYLAISGSDRDPISSGGQMWQDTPLTTERAGDGPGAGQPISGWTGTGVSGKYSIQLAGVCAVVAPPYPVALSAIGTPSPNVVYSSCASGIVTFPLNVTAGTSPSSTGITASVNASSLGLGTIHLTGPGTGGLFSAAAAVGARPHGAYPLPFTVADAQGRTFNGTMYYAVSDTGGLCCLPTGSCATLPCNACVAQGGTYRGGILGCDLSPCSSPSEIEPNNSAAQSTDATRSFRRYTGNLFHLGFTGNISSSTDADYFNIGALQVGDVLTASQSGAPSLSGTNTDPFFRLYRAGSGSIIASDDDGGPGFDALLWRYTIATSDTYYARGFRAGTSNTGTYRIGLWLENSGATPFTGGTFTAEVEPNESIAGANNASSSWRAVQYVSTMLGTITTGDSDFFAYNFASGDLLSLRVFADSGLDARVALTNAGGTAITLEDGTSAGPSGDSPIYSYIIPSTGTYRINVLGAAGTGEYVLRVYLSTNTPPPLPCVADVDDGGGTGVPDGGVTIDDLIFYLQIFDNGDIRADVDDGSFTGGRDGGITIDDLLYYLFRFDSGC